MDAQSAQRLHDGVFTLLGVTARDALWDTVIVPRFVDRGRELISSLFSSASHSLDTVLAHSLSMKTTPASASSTATDSNRDMWATPLLSFREIESTCVDALKQQQINSGASGGGGGHGSNQERYRTIRLVHNVAYN